MFAFESPGIQHTHPDRHTHQHPHTHKHKDTGYICQLLAHAFQAVLNWDRWLVLFFQAGMQGQSSRQREGEARGCDVTANHVSGSNGWLNFSNKTQGFLLWSAFVWIKLIWYFTYTPHRNSHLHLRRAPRIQQNGFHLAYLSNVSMEAWAAVTHKHTQGVRRPLWIWNTA